MIRTEKEYKAALLKLEQGQQALQEQRKRLESMHLSAEQLELAMSPLLSFHNQFKKEVENYEKVKNRDWKFIYEFAELHHLGELFIVLRIAYGLTQRDLANLLGVSEAQISKDERNEYHGISLERAMKIMDALKINPPHLQFKTDLDRKHLMQGNAS